MFPVFAALAMAVIIFVASLSSQTISILVLGFNSEPEADPGLSPLVTSF